MRKATLIAAVVTPVIAGAAGFMIARAGNAAANDASGYCTSPTLYVDMAPGVSLVTGGSESQADCAGAACTIFGAEQVEINVDGHVQCMDVKEGQSLTLTRRDGAVMVEESTVR